MRVTKVGFCLFCGVCLLACLLVFPPNRVYISEITLISVDCYYIGNMEEQLTMTGLL